MENFLCVFTCDEYVYRWNSCKQNKQAANNRTATNNQMVTPEGEKLHSDSGISVDTQSLQEQQQQAQAEVQASRSHTQEQIGKLSLTQHTAAASLRQGQIILKSILRILE